jgi:N-[(2S)-2-amino-2-carboxyethyl]-L-glutamate dehydrogenase
MSEREILLIGADDIQALLREREQETIDLVREVYLVHARGGSMLPHATLLALPGAPGNRIMALPGFLGEEFATAGIKWVSSFPANIDRGQDRATAVIILNSLENGRPDAILEGSQISAKRTAASAALAAQVLASCGTTVQLGIIGCGVINLEIAHFLTTVLSDVRQVALFDSDATRSSRFARKIQGAHPQIRAEVSPDLESVLASSSVVSIATTASSPHIFDLSMCHPGITILHISLRDIDPHALMGAFNIVDDIDHVCRAQTSIHLAEQLAGNRSFINATLAEVIRGETPVLRPDDRPAIFSPFGLGVLDLALSKRVRELALLHGFGVRLGTFLPQSWLVTATEPGASGDKIAQVTAER